MNDINSQDTRPIPPLPGGGSWSFDEATWAWVSTSPAPAKPAAQTVAAPEIQSAEEE